ncbi:MAG: IMP dehydrogenase, partial [Solobacterium sp.]|nr:IMP dehydrogenase [Solobacterium sp.]
MAKYYSEPSHTFSEYLLVPGLTGEKNIPTNVSLKTPLTKYKKGQKPAISLNIPMVSAVMQSVSGDELAIALAKEGGMSFIFGAQSVESQAAMVARVKNYKAGYVVSDANVKPDTTIAEMLEILEATGHSTMAVTDDGTSNGKLLGMLTSRDYRLGHVKMSDPVSKYMTDRSKLVVGSEKDDLTVCNDIIWTHKLNQLPIVDKDDRLLYLVFRKDYDSHKEHPLEILDSEKRFMVGAGINTRDYEERIPALIDAGVDCLVIDSSDGYSVWQANVIKWVRKKYGEKVKIGAGNVV